MGMIVEERRLRIPGVIERVPVACDFVVDAARRAGLDERAVYHCQLAVDEACTNVVEHGYGDDGANQAIDIVCRQEDDRFSIIVIDDSPAFDPLARIDPDPLAALDDREPGGWGIFFIKKVMDEVVYQYDASRNNLIMVKRIDPPHTPSAHTTSLVSVTPSAQHIWLIAPHGRLDGNLSPSIEHVLQQQLDVGRKYLILDLTQVDFISSNGLKILVSVWQRARELKGELVLASAQPRVREVLQMIGLDLVFSLYSSAQDAALHLRAKLPG